MFRVLLALLGLWLGFWAIFYAIPLVGWMLWPAVWLRDRVRAPITFGQRLKHAERWNAEHPEDPIIVGLDDERSMDNGGPGSD